MKMDPLLEDAAVRSTRYLANLPQRSVAPTPQALARIRELSHLPADPTPAHEVLALLDEVGSPATVASAGPRYHGFVIGGSLPAALAAHWLATAWDQNAGSRAASPLAAELEEIVLGWLGEILALPPGIGGGFTTGATMANFTSLAAARHALLARQGWDVEEHGLYGAPPLRVVVGDEVHVTVLKALTLLGLGRARVERVPVDGQGRMRADALPELDASTIVCAQAGNVNTGAFDPLPEIASAVEDAGGWLHVDGAFGLWAAASPTRRHLTRGAERADSWAIDGHKWLNVPYDSGFALTRRPDDMRAAMAALPAAYLFTKGGREPREYVPENSRRARVIDTWAALRNLGKSGVAEMVERNCRQAARIATGLREAGHEVLNDVVINQVLVSFGDAKRNEVVIDRIQREGTTWCGGTEWQGRHAMRISVSSWATTDADAERTLDAILRAAWES